MTTSETGATDAHPLLRTWFELDGGAYRAAQSRRRFRGPADVVQEQRHALAGIPQDQPGRQGADAADRRPRADRGRGHPVLSRQALSRSEAVARKRYRGRGTGGILDVVHRLDPASGTAEGF